MKSGSPGRLSLPDVSSLLVIDYGSQYTRLIVRRLRDRRFYAHLCTPDQARQAITGPGLAGVVLSGGPGTVAQSYDPGLIDDIFARSLPVLGICLGAQMLCHHFDGTVESRDEASEFGESILQVDPANPSLLHVTNDHRLMSWMSHSDYVATLGESCQTLAMTSDGYCAAFQVQDRPIFGLMFHPEVSHTQKGTEILAAFAGQVCGCKASWQAGQQNQRLIDTIRTQVGEGRVLTAFSGGIDSLVVGVLVHRAIGERGINVFVDTGLLRQDDLAFIDTIQAETGLQIDQIDAQDVFIKRLAGVSDPEEKRKIIGRTFIEVFTDHVRGLGPFSHLAQGTLYTDIIESGGASGAHTIKSHHNVGGLPQELGFELLEPLKELYKDEVRELGVSLGIDRQFVRRHPFPGPGLAVRVLGALDAQTIDIARQVDALFIEALRYHDLYDKVWQAFAVLTPLRSVGVVGDQRAMGYVCALRAVTSVDGMTAQAAMLPADFLTNITNKICNRIPQIGRVVYDYTSKPPGTIEWE
ncbi:MAG: glutamine-hydrolyzing GMP synthase [Pseudomonadota bacterium]